MDLKRVTEWLVTSEGAGKAIAATISVPAAIWAATTKALDPVVKYLGLPAWVSFAGAFLVVAAFVWLLWRSFRRFVRASRLERPDAFTLRPTSPVTLIGRSEDLASLLTCVRRYRLVLQAGE